MRFKPTCRRLWTQRLIQIEVEDPLKNEEVSVSYTMIYEQEQDCRGPAGDDGELDDPVGDHRKTQIDELSKTQAGVPSVATVLPDFDDILGIRSADDQIVKAEAELVEHIEGNSLAKRTELSAEDQEFAEWREQYDQMYS